jgi:S-DNA-T family DNA segregation ATPase FtsK/SpoIIIE
MIPVVTNPDQAAGALNWAVAEMDRRYNEFAKYNVRDLKGYNQKIDKEFAPKDPEKPAHMAYLVVIIDELADLMMVAPGDVEDSIIRLAQKARAAGIHLIVATQKPIATVITSLIKSNIPSRIAFAVSSGTDSRTILDTGGAEKLLGKGDMLYFPAGVSKPIRVQGAFESDEEVAKVTDYIKDLGEVHGGEQEDINLNMTSSKMSLIDDGNGNQEFDELFVQAGKFVIEKEKASSGMLQRMFRIGFNRAARILDQLYDAGVVGEEEGTKPRKVLMTEEEFEQFISGM